MKYDLPLMETALCLWEAYIDREHTDDTFNPDLRGNIGSYELRRQILLLVPAVEDLWRSLDPDIQHCLTFDFDFCPLVIECCVDWNGEEGRMALWPDAKERIVARVHIAHQFGRAA